MTKDYGVWVAALLAVSVMAGCGLGAKTDAPEPAERSGASESAQVQETSGNAYPANYAEACVGQSMRTVEQNLVNEGIRDQVTAAQMKKAREASQILCECLVEKLEERLPYERAAAADIAFGKGQEANPDDMAIMEQATTECKQERLPADFFN